MARWAWAPDPSNPPPLALTLVVSVREPAVRGGL